MRTLAVISALTLLGCYTGEPARPGEIRDAGSEEAPPSRDYPPMPDEPSQEGDTMCHKSEHIVFHLDGGLTIIYDIPLPCDPFWKMKDRGDPPP
jgi:hypothetical protein